MQNSAFLPSFLFLKDFAQRTYTKLNFPLIFTLFLEKKLVGVPGGFQISNFKWGPLNGKNLFYPTTPTPRGLGCWQKCWGFVFSCPPPPSSFWPFFKNIIHPRKSFYGSQKWKLGYKKMKILQGNKFLQFFGAAHTF